MGDEPTSVAVADTPAAVPISSNESEGRNTLPDLAGSIEPSAARGTAAGAVHESSGTDGAVTKPEEQETRPAEQQATASTSLTSTADGGVTGDAASVQSTGAAGGLPSIPPAAPSAPAPAAALASTVRAPSPSVSPAPTSKKFASSLSVNRKFLEKASTEKVKEAPKVAIARTATPPAPTPVSGSHPRLLTGKISSASSGSPSLSLNSSSSTSAAGGTSGTAGSSSPAPTGWLKTAVAASAEGVQPQVMSQHMGSGLGDKSGGGGPYDRSRGFGGMGAGGQPSRGWGSRGPGGRDGGGYGPGGEFPTAAEAANAKNLRAQAIIEQMQSRDRAVAARAAAAAAANAHLLQGLDAFRGVHLDPNASHWDEDVDDDFLDDTIEFGDGTQYKISEETAAAPAEEEVAEPHPSDMARREAPLPAGERNETVSREERFKDDYDRSYNKRSSTASSSSAQAQPAESRNLFNERLGKFEPYAGRKSISEVASGKPGSDLPPHLDQRGSGGPRRASITSPRQEKAALPPPTPNAWGAPRAPVARRPSIEHHAGPPPGARRPSNEAGRRPSMDTGARRPSVGALDGPGGRQLPPHLAGQMPSRGGPPPPLAQTGRRPSNSAVLSPPRGHAPLPPIAGSPAPAQPAPAVTPAAAPAAPAAPVEDLESMHAREMHAAAERAKKRRQEEEQARLEQIERAKKKAAELEERMKKAEEEKRAAQAPPKLALSSTPASAPAGKAVPNGAPTSTSAPPPPRPAERLESWRKPLPKSVVAPPPGAPTIPTVSSAPAAAPIRPAQPSTPIVKPEPTKILAREPHPQGQAKPTLAEAPKGPAASRPPPPPASAPAQATATPAAPRAPLETQDRAWRRADAPPPSQSLARPAPSANGNRQLPPHLAAAAGSAPSSTEPTRSAPAGGRPADSYVRPSPPASATVATKPSPAPTPTPASTPTPATAPKPAPALAVEVSTAPKVPEAKPVAAKEPSSAPSTATSIAAPVSPHASRKGASTSVSTQQQQQQQKGAHRVPEMSQFDDLMSRIKGAMNTPAPPKTPTRTGADNLETVSTSNSSPVGGVPTVRLPAPSSSSAVAPNLTNLPTPSPSPPATVSKTPFAVEPRGIKTPGAQQQQQQRGRNGETVARKVSTRTAPYFESREPLPLFERSRAARSPSPSPVWKRFAVVLPAPSQGAPRRAPTPHQIAAFKDWRKPHKVAILSWNPPMTQLSSRRMSRDDLLHPKKYIRGVLQCPVSVPKTRIQRRETIEVVERKVRVVKEVGVAGEAKKESDGAIIPRGRGRGRAPEEGPWRRAEAQSPETVVKPTEPSKAVVGDAPTELLSTTAPSTAELFNGASADAGLSAFRSTNGPSASDRSFMVTSGLDGEVVNMGPRESLAAPGADTGRSATMTPPTPKVFDSQQGINSPSASAVWNGPLSLSVLDPTAPSVWSAPSSEVPVHSRSISLGAPKQENSLQGIADDDFPAAIPSSLADLKSEDDALTDNQSDSVKRAVPKDDARLRAAAPSFSSFNPQAGAFDGGRPSLSSPHYPSFGRQASPTPLTYPSLTGGPSPQSSYSPAPPLHALHGYGQATPQHYPSFAVPSHSSTGMPASYGQHLQQQHQQHQQQAQMHPSFSQSPFSSQHLGNSSPFPSYRPQPAQPQGITNPALLANHYGNNSYQGGAFGAVGGGSGGRSSSSGYPAAAPGGYGRPIPSPYQAGSYRHDSSSSFGGSPHEVRSPLPFLGQPSPVLMPQQQPSPFVQHQQLPYGSTGVGGYSPQAQVAALYARGASGMGVGTGAAGGGMGAGGAQQGYRRPQW